MSELSYEEKLKAIDGVGRKTVKDITQVYESEEQLVAAVNSGESLPFKDDVSALLVEAFKTVPEAEDATDAAEDEPSDKQDEEASPEEEADQSADASEAPAEEETDNASEESTEEEAPEEETAEDSPEESEESEDSEKDSGSKPDASNPMMALNIAGFDLRFLKGRQTWTLRVQASVPLIAIPGWVKTTPDWREHRRDKHIEIKPLKVKS